MKQMFKDDWHKLAGYGVSTFLGFVLFAPEFFSKVPVLVQIAQYAAMGGLTGFGVVGVHRVVRDARADDGAESKK